MYEIILDDCDRFEKIAEFYKRICKTIYKELLQDVVRTEYARGGETIHRGYYCPSPVYDIIIGGASRGRLLKNIKRIKRKPDYEFGFNFTNELIVIQNSFYKEFIVRNQETELSILFNKYGIQAVTECRYSDDKIQSYVYCLFLDGKVDDYRKEEYTYGSEGLHYVDYYSFMPMRINIPKEIRELIFDKGEELKPIYSHEKYEFTHKDGYLYQYRVIPTHDPMINDNRTFSTNYPVPNFSFDIRVKRKI